MEAAHWNLTNTRSKKCTLLIWDALHWFPMWGHFEFKILMLMCSLLAICAPSYLRDLCISVPLSDRRSLYSATQVDVAGPPSHDATMQHVSFAVVSPLFWNRLLCNLRYELLLSMPVFCKRLKTILFSHGLVWSDQQKLWWRGATEISTYNCNNVHCFTCFMSIVPNYQLTWTNIINQFLQFLNLFEFQQCLRMVVEHVLMTSYAT